jgi:hypothetical protein
MPGWILALLLAAASLLPVGAYATFAWLGHTYSMGGTGGVHGAPGPLMGAGLPILLIGGAGYWAVRRFRNKAR